MAQDWDPETLKARRELNGDHVFVALRMVASLGSDLLDRSIQSSGMGAYSTVHVDIRVATGEDTSELYRVTVQRQAGEAF